MDCMNMYLQISCWRKVFDTIFTFIWVFIMNCSNVSLQLSWVIKFLITRFTFVISFSFMNWRDITQSLNSNSPRMHCFLQNQWPTKNPVVKSTDYGGLLGYTLEYQASVPRSKLILRTFIFKLLLNYALNLAARLLQQFGAGEIQTRNLGGALSTTVNTLVNTILFWDNDGFSETNMIRIIARSLQQIHEWI